MELQSEITYVVIRVLVLENTLNNCELIYLGNLNMVIPLWVADSALELEFFAYALCFMLKEIAKPVNNNRFRTVKVWDVPLNSPPVSHLVVVYVIRSTLLVSQCLCASNPILLYNGPKVMLAVRIHQRVAIKCMYV